MSTHTPGPWMIGTSHDGFRTVSDGTKTICSVGAADVFPAIEADARLIAAAPDLLQALKIAVRYMPTDNSEGTERYQVEQIIAQAEGRA